MLKFSFISSFCFILFCLLIPLLHGSPVGTKPANLVNQTCKICDNESTTSCLYNFCLTSLQPIPISHITNLEGLTILTMELALVNATTTLSTIKELMDDGGGLDPYAMDCLDDCSELYLDAVEIIIDAVGAFLNQQYDTVNVWVSTAMEAASKCERAFTDKKSESSPLTKENYNLIMLCKIVLCMINLLSLASSSASS